MDTGFGRKGSGMNWAIGIDVYTLLCVEPIASGKLRELRLVLCGDLDGWGGEGRGRICIHIADSLCYTVETIQHCKATPP